LLVEEESDEMDAQVKAVDEGFVTAIPVTAALSYDDAIVNKRIARHETAKPEAARSAAYQAARSIDVFYAQGASSEIARDINRDLVLELIRFHQPVSRVDLARRSGLQPSTISSIVEELVTEQWVEAGAIVQGSRGRPSTTLSLNPDMVTLALDLRPDRAIVAIVDLSGRFLAQETIPIVVEPKPATARIIAAMSSLRDRFPGKRFEGVGVCVPGRVHPVTQRILLAPNLHWGHFDLKGALEKGLHLQVEIDNDANVCLLSELWHGRLPGVTNAVLVAVSEGIGAAILMGGQMQAGFQGLAGEFGHLPMDPSGPLCGCGQRGCWEMFASSRAALQHYRKLKPGSRGLTISDLLRLAESGDKSAIEAITRQAVALGKGLRLVTAALSPELVLMTGELTSVWGKIGPVIEREMRKTMLAPPPPRLAIAGDGYLARLSGSAAMLLQRHSRYHRSTHPSRSRKRSSSQA
jgi:predicted NBD/HSP70 family sugar kinase